MTAPTVSVVMPSHNDEAYIATAIESVLGQTFRDLELIVIDDGSTDDTRRIVRSFGSNVRLIEQENAGSAVARNRGIEAATGRYVAFLDADDWWHPQKTAVQIAAMQQRSSAGARMSYTSFERWRQDDTGVFPDPAGLLPAHLDVEPRPAARLEWNYPELLDDCIVWTSTVIVERDLLKSTGGFDPALRKGQDYDMWLRLSQMAQWLLVDHASALYRIRPSSITYVPKPVNYEYEILRRAVDRWGLRSPDGRMADARMLQERMTRSCTNFGLMHLGEGDPRLAMQAFRQAIAHGGLNIRRVVLLMRAAMRAQFGGPGA